MANLKCIVVTPESTAFEEEATFVVIPMYDGEMGVGANHGPTIGRLGFGELRLKKESGEVLRYYVDGGFTQIADNVVSVLTPRAVPASELDIAAAQEQLEAALQRPSNTNELAQIRDREISQARSQIRVAQRSK